MNFDTPTTIRVTIQRSIGQYEYAKFEAESTIPPGHTDADVTAARTALTLALDAAVEKPPFEPDTRVVTSAIEPDIAPEPEKVQEPAPEPEKVQEPEKAQEPAVPTRQEVNARLAELARSKGQELASQAFIAACEAVGVVPGQNIPDDKLAAFVAALPKASE